MRIARPMLVLKLNIINNFSMLFGKDGDVMMMMMIAVY